MREKMLEIADGLEARAKAYRAPYEALEEKQVAFLGSPSYPIATVLDEVAMQIRAVLNPSKEDGESVDVYSCGHTGPNDMGRRREFEVQCPDCYEKEHGPMPKSHDCAAPNCRVQIFDPEEEFCQHHEANRAFGVE